CWDREEFGVAWRSLQMPLFRWAGTIDRILAAEPLPELSGPTINAFSDYGGQHGGSLFDLTSVLYTDVWASASWERQRRELRRRYLPDSRRIAFKSLGDRHRQLALAPFL